MSLLSVPPSTRYLRAGPFCERLAASTVGALPPDPPPREPLAAGTSATGAPAPSTPRRRRYAFATWMSCDAVAPDLLSNRFAREPVRQ